jgi:hypothetical protein
MRQKRERIATGGCRNMLILRGRIDRDVWQTSCSPHADAAVLLIDCRPRAYRLVVLQFVAGSTHDRLDIRSFYLLYWRQLAHG